jgi:hypothetical protein
MTILSGGNVGIGTPSPNTDLHLKANAPQGFAIQMENTSTMKRLYLGNYGTPGGGNQRPGLNNANTSFLYADNPLVFTTPGGIFFSGSTTAEHMRINPNGNVGIGIMVPAFNTQSPSAAKQSGLLKSQKICVRRQGQQGSIPKTRMCCFSNRSPWQ